ncbi:N-6 DNA methylase [uncultured Gemmiger sp.]|uniref:N-6 DNA methylase n=1 Tax=uncultured Gemmiger sp. TaxID=1623490 RepID=UPI0025FB2487|nr:N-6 DNA methylase [uncultured Gemmiger sp.]
MSTKRPKPELSAHFIRGKWILKAADTAKYNARLKEIDLPDDYAVYGYEPSKGGIPAAYWVCKQSVGKCPECHTRYLENAIASVSESKLTHYCRVEIPHKGRKPTYEIHPATLYLRRIRWLCYNCYSKQKTYNARMQDDSKLVDKEDKKLTLQVKEHLGQQAMHMEINTLAEIFDISPHTVDKCFDKAVDKYDKERDWDNISTLGLYTITLNVQGQQADCCLCANVDTEKLIEFFPYEDTKAAEAFLSKLKNKQNIQRVFTSIDSAAFDFAKTNFPIETIMVDRLDVRKRLLNGLETVKKSNDDSKNYPLLRRNWTLLDNDDEAIPTNSKDYILLKKVLDAFPRIGVAYWLKEAGMDIYRKLAGQCKLVNDWILSDKHNILPYEQLQQCMTQAKEPVVRFAEQYNGVDRSRYEKAILAAEKPLMSCAKSNKKSKSARWSRAASFKKIRARVLYGAAMMANYFAAQEPNEKSHEEYAIHKEMYFTTVDRITTAKINTPAVETDVALEIYLHNFGIPLSIYPNLLGYGLEEYSHVLLDLKPLKKDRQYLSREEQTEETMSDKIAFDALWDESPIDVTPEVNFIWSIANKLRGSYMPDKYGDVIIPMTILRRLECALEPHKEAVLAKFAENPNYPPKAMYRISGYQFYNTSPYTLKELCNEPDNIKSNFKVYIQGFSAEVQEIFNGLEMFSHIDKMDKDGCLFSVVQAFADLDLDPKTYDSIKMGYIFEHLIGKFYQNVDAGQFYTGRDIIKCLVAVLISEGCDDIFDDGKVVTVCDQACGTGGMLSTAYSFIKHYNPSADVRLFGQEFMPQSYAVGLAEMMIKGQNIENFRNADTFKEDCFPNIKMRFVLENPPFGTPWAGKDAKAGQEDAVRNEFKRGKNGRWGAGLPSGGDSQLIFMQSAIDKMDDKVGRAAIIENGSPLFTGGTASGESQIRRWILEQDLLEAIIALPTDLFYNTGIATYVWILSKNKRPERKGYVQLIDATSIFHKLRKAAGNKRNELLPEDRSKIVKLYTAFEENEYCKIFKNEEFLYREYTVMQPLQRSYAITEERVEQMLADGTLNSVYDPAKVDELEEQGTQISVKDKMKLDKLYEQKPVYEGIVSALQNAVSDEVYLSPEAFVPVLRKVLAEVTDDKKLLDKIADGLSVMDKNAEIQRDKHGAILYDKNSKDTELVPYEESIDDYMAREVLPHVPDAKAFWEEKVDAKKPVIKTGAEIPFTQYFYKYEQPVPSEELAKQFTELEQSVSQRIAKLFG